MAGGPQSTSLDALLTKTIQANTVSLPSRPFLNFSGSLTSSDDPITNGGTTNITFLSNGALLGIAQVGANTLVGETPQDNVAVAANTTVTVFTLPSPPLSFKERAIVSVLFTFSDQATGNMVGYIQRSIFVGSSNAGVISNPVGATSNADWDSTGNVPNNINIGLAGVSAQLQISANTIIGTITAPPSVALWVNAAVVSWSRVKFPGTGPVAVVASMSPNSGPGVGGVGNNVTLNAQAGTNFLGATACSLAGVTASIVSIASDGSTMVVTPGNYSSFPAPHNGPATVTNANGPGSDVSGGYTYTTSTGSPVTIFGSGVVYWRAQDAVHSGSTLTNIPPANGTGTMLPVGSPTYNASSANWTPNQPSITLNGTTDYLKIASYALGATKSIFTWVVIRAVNNGNLQTLISYNGIADILFRLEVAGTPSTYSGARGTASSGTSVTGSDHLVMGFADDASAGSSGKSFVQVDNGTGVTTTGTGNAFAASAELDIGSNAGANFLQGEVVEAGLLAMTPGTFPTAGQISNLHSYVAQNYGTP